MSCYAPIQPYDGDLQCEPEAGGISKLVVFHDNLPSDPSDGQEIGTMISNNEATLIEDVKIGFAEPSEITGTSYVSCVPDAAINYDREATLLDAKVVPQNVEFYNSVNSANRRNVAGVLFYECSAERVTFVDKPVTFSGGRVVPETDDDSQHFSYTLRWRSKNDPHIYSKPANVFD